MQEAIEYKAARKTVTQISITGGGGLTRVTVSKFKGWENCDAGSLAITGEYGPWEHSWTSIGAGTFGEFLSGLEMHYAMRKLAGSGAYEFDLQETQRAVRRYILDTRMRQDLTKDQARKFYTLVDDMRGRTAEEAYAGTGESLVYELFRGEPIVSKRVCANVRHFWDNLWPLIVREVLAFEKEAKKEEVSLIAASEAP